MTSSDTPQRWNYTQELPALGAGRGLPSLPMAVFITHEVITELGPGCLLPCCLLEVSFSAHGRLPPTQPEDSGDETQGCLSLEGSGWA